MTVQFVTTDYEFSHGRAPRGYGSWAFGFGGVPANVNDAWFAPASTFADAKRAARAEAERRGFSGMVWVLS